MLHDETRKLLIEAWNKTHNAKEIAECFSVNTSTVYRLEKQMRETGSVKTMTSQRGRKHALTPEDIQNIDWVVQQEPDLTIDEIIDKLGLHVCNETVRKAVIKLGYSYKKKSYDFPHRLQEYMKFWLYLVVCEYTCKQKKPFEKRISPLSKGKLTNWNFWMRIICEKNLTSS